LSRRFEFLDRCGYVPFASLWLKFSLAFIRY
jgi:hypothetical protein